MTFDSSRPEPGSTGTATATAKQNADFADYADLTHPGADASRATSLDSLVERPREAHGFPRPLTKKMDLNEVVGRVTALGANLRNPRNCSSNLR